MGKSYEFSWDVYLTAFGYTKPGIYTFKEAVDLDSRNSFVRLEPLVAVSEKGWWFFGADNTLASPNHHWRSYTPENIVTQLKYNDLASALLWTA